MPLKRGECPRRHSPRCLSRRRRMVVHLMAASQDEMSSAGPRRHPRRAIALALTIIGLAVLGQPATSSADAPTTITVAPTTVQPGNCIVFGDGRFWTPYAGFVYKNIPAFQLQPGDILAFDTLAVNDARKAAEQETVGERCPDRVRPGADGGHLRQTLRPRQSTRSRR